MTKVLSSSDGQETKRVLLCTLNESQLYRAADDTKDEVLGFLKDLTEDLVSNTDFSAASQAPGPSLSIFFALLDEILALDYRAIAPHLHTIFNVIWTCQGKHQLFSHTQQEHYLARRRSS